MKKLVVAIVYFFLSAALLASPPLLVGHRGCNMGVENTAEAFSNGVARGYKFLETDVRVSADTAFVLCHDTDTRRLGGSLEIASSTLEELRAEPLRQTRADGPYRATYTGTITTLGEYLEICKNADVRPVVELKWSTGINSSDCSLLPLLVDSISAYGMRDKVVILTSMRPCLEFVRSNFPDIEIQWLGRVDWTDRIGWCDSLRFHPNIAHDQLSSADIARCHAAGLKVNCWTVDSPERADSLMFMGVDMLTTNKLTPDSEGRLVPSQTR